MSVASPPARKRSVLSGGKSLEVGAFRGMYLDGAEYFRVDACCLLPETLTANVHTFLETVHELSTIFFVVSHATTPFRFARCSTAFSLVLALITFMVTSEPNTCIVSGNLVSDLAQRQSKLRQGIQR